ncbi:Formate-dependent nitrite reductase, periplasmic cytochrome c552 subunit [Alteromonadaceae bacterium Bs31]|nr:Formate-dependent nitrite reductase, periplasmic cytochrome c552 subunit [Alteromonadaceae bacterium Bs31]
MKYWIWVAWLAVVVSIFSYYSWRLFATEEKSDFLIGETSYGHYQIEMSCDSCHTSAFGGTEVLQDACENCHAADLEMAHDSHPTKKFTDPRNADRLEVVDARYCVSCHTEHQHEQTREMGVTLPDDYCYHCHEDIAEDRESHKDLPFDSCASAGCHNFHDNRALYENFLIDNANQPWLLEIANLEVPNAANKTIKENAVSLGLADADFTKAKKVNVTETVLNDWAHSSHAAAGVNCMGCHQGEDKEWIEKPGHEQCGSCHANEVQTFTEGKHGMRLSTVLSKPLKPMSPSESHMKFTETGQQSHQNCVACHQSHTFDRVFAATEACLDCHADEHSLAFLDSPHGQLWQANKSDKETAAEQVSCATCHMPRMVKGKGEKQIVSVNHNQNFNLKPNEKMIRSVCMDCHGLGFAINAIADEALIKNNFNGQPGVEIESIDWALKREE